MKQKLSITFNILFAFLLSKNLSGQNLYQNLEINPVQYDTKNDLEKKRTRREYLTKTTTSDTISFPFFDDFSNGDLTWVPSKFYFAKPIYWIGFFSNQTARAFGDEGLNLKTTSRGRSWEKIENNETRTYLSATFIGNGDNGWICGTKGYLAKTTDNGITWTPKTSPSQRPNAALKNVSFFSSQKGLLVDSLGKIFYTTDGENWNAGATNPAFYARSVDWANANDAVAAGDSGKLAFTGNAGESWEILEFKSDTAFNFNKVKMLDGIFGLAVGNGGIIYKTLNSGKSWFKCKNSSTQNLLDVDVADININICWAVGQSGTILFSGDKGNNWASVKSGLEDDLQCLDMVNEFRGFIGSSNGRILQIMMDPTKAESRLWEKNSGVFINNTYAFNPITIGVASFDGLNSSGLPYNTSTTGSKNGACDTLSSVRIDLAGLSENLYLSYYYQPGSLAVEIKPNETDSLVLQFKSSKGFWKSVWNVKGESNTQSVPFRYVSIPINDSLKHKGFQFRFINFGEQTGNFDIWNLDYVRLDSSNPPGDSLLSDYAISRLPGRLLKDYSAFPLSQFKYCLANNINIFGDSILGEAISFNSSITPASATFYLRSQIPDTVKTLATFQNDELNGLENPFDPGVTRKKLAIPVSKFKSNLEAINEFSNLQYGFGLNAAQGNEFQGNDTLLASLNLSTVMAYDDGSAELSLLVGNSLSRGAVKFYLPQTDTLTDIALHFPRRPFTFQDIVSFTLILYESIEAGTKNEKVIFRLPVILPTNDSSNKFDFYSLRIRPLNQRILEGGKHFYIGWEQGTVDNGNEVRIGVDINSKSPFPLLYKVNEDWLERPDNFPLMIRPIFGIEKPVSVKDRFSKSSSPFFPNPARALIQNKESFKQLRIFNHLGQVVYKLEDGAPMQEINFNLNPGFYTARWIATNGDWNCQKLIIE